MKRKNVQITKKQEKKLKQKAFQQKCSEAEVIRKALDKYFKEGK